MFRQLTEDVSARAAGDVHVMGKSITVSSGARERMLLGRLLWKLTKIVFSKSVHS